MTYSVPEGSVDLESAKKGGVYVPSKGDPIEEHT